MSTKIKDAITIADAAKEYGVSRQRMHVLIKTYDVRPVALSPRLLVITRRELRKIPVERKPGPRRGK